MDSYGFKWQEGNDIDSKGEKFAWGQFINGERRIRFACGINFFLLRYHIKKHDLSHTHFMELCNHKSPDFSDFSGNLHEDLKCILQDLSTRGTSFLNGSVVSILNRLTK